VKPRSAAGSRLLGMDCVLRRLDSPGRMPKPRAERLRDTGPSTGDYVVVIEQAPTFQQFLSLSQLDHLAKNIGSKMRYRRVFDR